MSQAAIRRGIAAPALVLGLLLAGAGPAAAAPPQIISVAVGEGSVSATGATLKGQVNPEGSPTAYRFEYLSEAAYEANLQAARDPFFGAVFAPASGAGPVGSGAGAAPVFQHLAGLTPETAYRFRLRVAHSGEEAVFSATRPFATAPATNVFELLDHRGWELVSPLDKAGGAIQPPGQVSGGGVFQAAGAGGAFTYSSADSFGEGAQGAPTGSQYLATRGSGGWTSANITTPLLSGSYGSEPDGVPYQLFSGDLAFGLLSNGERCRGEAGGECPVANPPLPGSGAPAGYRDYYRRGPTGAFESLLTAADLTHTSLGPEEFELRLVAATPDLAHVVLTSCAALTQNATEAAVPGGCDPEAQNLYEWSAGSGLTLVNLLPGQTAGTPGARLAGPDGAVSSDGSRVYFQIGEGVYLREAGLTKAVPAGPGAEFETASPSDGSIAYLIEAGQLLGYSATSGTATPLTSGAAVEGVLGTSADGGVVYYAQGGAVFRRASATVTEVAASALPSDWLPGGGTSRVAADGNHLLFLSSAELTGYPNEGETEVFLYGPPPGGGAPALACVSCNPSGEAPRGSATFPGARRNGTGATTYEPRALSADGRRAFFESDDSLVAQDTNRQPDVYEWEAAGEGTCARPGGCVQLISGGRDNEPSYFLDADAGGSEAFFLTAGSLDPRDPGSYDVYVAREGGGFALPEEPIPCLADACQVLPEAPEDPTPGSLVPSSGNPPLAIEGAKPKHKKHKHRHKKAKHKARQSKGARR